MYPLRRRLFTAMLVGALLGTYVSGPAGGAHSRVGHPFVVQFATCPARARRRRSRRGVRAIWWRVARRVSAAGARAGRDTVRPRGAPADSYARGPPEARASCIARGRPVAAPLRRGVALRTDPGGAARHMAVRCLGMPGVRPTARNHTRLAEMAPARGDDEKRTSDRESDLRDDRPTARGGSRSGPAGGMQWVACAGRMPLSREARTGFPTPHLCSTIRSGGRGALGRLGQPGCGAALTGWGGGPDAGSIEPFVSSSLWRPQWTIATAPPAIRWSIAGAVTIRSLRTIARAASFTPIARSGSSCVPRANRPEPRAGSHAEGVMGASAERSAITRAGISRGRLAQRRGSACWARPGDEVDVVDVDGVAVTAA